MANNTIPLKQCSRKDECLHPEGPNLPATTEYFMMHKGKLYCQCHYCRKNAKKQSHVRNREHNNARTKRWYDEHPDYSSNRHKNRYATDPEYAEAARERARRWAEEHPEECCLRARKSYWSNPERARQYKRVYYRENKEQIAAYTREYRILNRDRHNQLNREWDKRHPEQARARAARRRARVKGAPGKYTSADVELQRKAQTNRKGQLICWWCNEPIKGQYHIDHRIALDRDGTNYPSNLVLTHDRCNLSKGNKTPAEWIGRLL